jgi:hypothetical protein
MLLHKPHSPHPCGLATQDDKLLLRLLHSVRPVLQQLPRGLGEGNQHREKAHVIPPHPGLLPQGEGAHLLKSTGLKVRALG